MPPGPRYSRESKERMTLMKKLMTFAAAAVLVAGCTTTDPYTGEQRTSRATQGAVIGALGGAIVGALTNTSSGEQAAKNALIGAGVGALAGGAVGNYMDQQEAELRRELEATGVGVRRVGDNIELIMPSNITFDTGSARVQDEFRRTLNSVATVLQRYDQTYIYVDGHTDTVGSRQFNQDLSEDRAAAVADMLIRRNIIAGRLIVRGFGENDPLIRTGDEVNEPQNRRVELQIVPYTS